MKRTAYIMLAAMMLLSLAACKGKDTPPTPTAAPTEAQTAPGVTLSPAEIQFSGDLSYDPETDFDPRLGSIFETFIDMGDYFYWRIEADQYLRYAYKSGEDSGVLCGRPECEHDKGNSGVTNKGCGGYITYGPNSVWRDGDKLYYIKTYLEYVEGKSLGAVYSMNLDGSDHSRVCSLPVLIGPSGSEMSPQYFYYHRGMIYCRCQQYDVVDGEPISLTGYYAIEPDGSGYTTIFESDTGANGYMGFMGEFCYILDNSHGHNNDEQAENIITLLRWSPNTRKTEVLYSGSDIYLPNPGQFFLSGGNIYIPSKFEDYVGERAVLRFKDGGWEEFIDFEAPDEHWTVYCISDGIAVARNYLEPNPYHEGYDRAAQQSTDIDVWIKDLDGETIYKGKLPMDWMEDCPTARRMKKLWDSHAFGNRNEIFFEFEMDIDNNSDDEATFIVRYEPKDGGLEATLVCFTVFSGSVD